MTSTRSGRTLQTARSVLQVLKLLTDAPNGLRGQDVAQALNKSTSTAVYLLNSLCSEGFAERDTVYGHYRLVDSVEPEVDPYKLSAEDLDMVVEELYARTNERTYLATLQEQYVMVHESRGRQGLPKVPGLGAQIGAETHATAIGKAILAHGGPESLQSYQDAYGLQPFTPLTLATTTDLGAELAAVRKKGFAVDNQEFAEGFCCIAAPIFDRAGVLCGALGLSTTKVRFAQKAHKLTPIVIAIARAASHHGMAPSWEPYSVPRSP